MYLYVQTTSGKIESSAYIVLDSTASSKSNSSYLINRNKYQVQVLPIDYASSKKKGTSYRSIYMKQ